MEDLHLHHRNIYDRIMCKRIADRSLDFGSIVGLLVCLGMHPHNGLWAFGEYFTNYFLTLAGGIWTNYPTLYFRQPGYNPGYKPSSRSVKLLTQFFIDPGRAGEHALDGPKCALIARFLLDCFIPRCSERDLLR